MPRLLLACLLWLAAGSTSASMLGGTVFDDANGSGARDTSEAGVPGVAVSNGRTIVRTDGNGAYRIETAPGDTAFVVKPADWWMANGTDGLPAFWRQQPVAHSAALEYGGLPAGEMIARADFALRRVAEPGKDLDVLVFADPQPKSSVDVDYYRRDIVEPLRGHTRAALGLSLGDIVDDDLSLYPAVKSVTASLGVPWLHVAGNHDVDLDATDDAGALQTYRRNFGPDTFAWEEARATFVMLDDVVSMPGSKPAYTGGFREDQFAFLQAYLPGVPSDRLLVIGVHIPLFEAAGRDTFRDADRRRLFALLERFPHVLLLSAHSHTQQHWFHDAATGWHGARPLHEYNVGAACGAFWSGVKDAVGIPDSTMADGTPNGYASLSVQTGGAYALAWHPARLDTLDASLTQAMSLHAPEALRRGAYPAWGVYANVFMGRDDTRVEFRVDGAGWTPMRRVEQPDPRLLVENMRDDLAGQLRGYDRSPEAKPSAHLWRGALPTDLDEGSHCVDVRAFVEHDDGHQASIDYRLLSADP